MTQKGKDNSQDAGKDEPFRVRLPGFISDEQVGLGDVVKRITYAAGIKPYGGCGAVASTQATLGWRKVRWPLPIPHGHGFPLHCGLTWPRISRAASSIWRCAVVGMDAPGAKDVSFGPEDFRSGRELKIHDTTGARP
jgi:hypothetical protein